MNDKERTASAVDGLVYDYSEMIGYILELISFLYFRKLPFSTQHLMICKRIFRHDVISSYLLFLA